MHQQYNRTVDALHLRETIVVEYNLVGRKRLRGLSDKPWKTLGKLHQLLVRMRARYDDDIDRRYSGSLSDGQRSYAITKRQTCSYIVHEKHIVWSVSSLTTVGRCDLPAHRYAVWMSYTKFHKPHKQFILEKLAVLKDVAVKQKSYSDTSKRYFFSIEYFYSRVCTRVSSNRNSR